MDPLAAGTVDTITPDEAPTLPGLFERRCARTPDAEAYREFDAAEGRWRGRSWREVHTLVQRWRSAFASEALAPGDRVAVMLPNGLRWVCFDLAAQSVGLVVVPLYPTDNARNAAGILRDCDARLLLLEEAEHWEALQAADGNLSRQLQRVLCAGSQQRDEVPGALMQSLDGWLQQPVPAALPFPTQADALATIVYTSGTTGRPMGAMLSHRNILADAGAVLQVVKAYREDVFLSFLPLSHALERTVGYYLPMMAGSTVAFARSAQHLPQDLSTVRPTVLVSVPRVYERAYSRIRQQLDRSSSPASALFDWAERAGWRRFEAAQHRAEPPGLAAEVAWPVLRYLVGDRVLARFGGRLRIAVSGGAPISPRLTHCFIGLGLPILQGYGLTEGAPVVTANSLEDNEPESVGRPLPGVQVKLGAGDELLVRGPNVMLGYWNAPEMTRHAIDADGWLHTGDIARIDANGHVHIVGRIKEILVTSTGEKLHPGALELAITEDALFEQALVVGEGRPFVAALLVLNTQAWMALAEGLGLDASARDSLHDARVRGAVIERLQHRLDAFPAYAQVRSVWMSLEPWTTEAGLVTPTLKNRRQALQERFVKEIDALYAAHGTAS